MLKLKGTKMGTVRGGGIECDRCGVECRALYGFAMSIDRVANTHNENVKNIVKKIDEKYGKHDFIICWDCTIRMMGILSLVQKAEADKILAKMEVADAEKANKGKNNAI